MSIQKWGTKLFGRKAWPAGIPRLYEDITPERLCTFFTPNQAKSVKLLPQVTILPFFSEDQSKDEVFFGAGLSRLMMRNLMLVNSISVRGPEDTAPTPIEFAETVSLTSQPNAIVITGTCSLKDEFKLDYLVLNEGKTVEKKSIHHRDIRDFILLCSESLHASLAQNNFQKLEDLRSKWSVCLPANADSIQRLGRIRLVINGDKDSDLIPFIFESISKDPKFPLLYQEIPTSESLKYRLKGWAMDPHDAQAAFELFIATWKSNGQYEPYALQFLRKAIEICPGHGKSHMCMLHSIPDHLTSPMIHHSELGYRLLPGNTFGISNYFLYLKRLGKSADDLAALGREGIAVDPEAPINYLNLIDILEESRHYQAALDIALDLQKLYHPEINPRTLYCLKQNPHIEKLLDLGDFDPAAENRQLIDKLRAKVAKDS